MSLLRSFHFALSLKNCPGRSSFSSTRVRTLLTVISSPLSSSAFASTRSSLSRILSDGVGMVASSATNEPRVHWARVVRSIANPINEGVSGRCDKLSDLKDHLTRRRQLQQARRQLVQCKSSKALWGKRSTGLTGANSGASLLSGVWTLATTSARTFLIRVQTRGASLSFGYISRHFHGYNDKLQMGDSH